MTLSDAKPVMLLALDDDTRRLVRLAAIVTTGAEEEIRNALAAAAGHIPDVWVDELLLQTYLFAGFPRALNAMREWRRVTPLPATADAGMDLGAGERQARGEETCAVVYGDMYRRLRHNIRALHPLLDDWMIVDGYGKVLSRPGLDLPRRELCIVAACAAAKQDRQLHSHLHGALNAGASAAVVDETLGALTDLIDADHMTSVRRLWARVRGT